MIHKLIYSLSICCAIFLFMTSSACNKELVGFDMVYKRDFVVKGGLSPSQGHYFVMSDFPANYSGFAMAKSSDTSQVLRIVPKSMRFTSKYPDVLFDAIRTVEVRISKKNFDEGTEVFYYPYPLPQGRNYLDLSPGIADIKTLIGKNEPFNIIVRLDFINTPPQELDVTCEFGFIAVTK